MVVVEETGRGEDGRLLSLGHDGRLERRIGRWMKQRSRWWLGHACIIICPQAAAGSRIWDGPGRLVPALSEIGRPGRGAMGDTKVRNASTVAGVSFVCGRALGRAVSWTPEWRGAQTCRGWRTGASGRRRGCRRGWGWQRICIWDMEWHPGSTAVPSGARLHASL